MKKLFLAVSAVLFSLTLTFAQEVNPEEKAKQTITEWTSQMNLTQEQQTQLYDLVLAHKKAKLAIKADTAQTDEAKKAEQIAALSAELDSKVDALLTEEQKPLYAKIVEERASKKQAPAVTPQVQ
ncbi:hypothetical protein [Sphingobacterium humi]|uniref:DUF4890 domain-containing protein n=1 Tax=Sphingobacterium humi TaxID=1796905 RepID=A0A6N8L4S9_9SPHI|nr:hypothetical protein [Sphingobacterium humi]MVZ63178.1 hypothetical protein [Sphingobacterium humi]